MRGILAGLTPSLHSQPLLLADLAERLTSGGNLFWLLMACVAIVGILAGAITKVISSIARERSRREIAAYIAEGSMTPEQGERLMVAGRTQEH